MEIDYTNRFLTGYLEAAMWADLRDENGDPMDDLDFSDLSDAFVAEATADCAAFQTECAEDLADLPSTSEQDGHDFWLTRQRHVAGFWDRGYGDAGQRLTDAARAYGETYLYVGDNGKVYGD